MANSNNPAGDRVLYIARGYRAANTRLELVETTVADHFAELADHRESLVKDGPYVVYATFRRPRRCSENVEGYTAAVIDIDRDTSADEIRHLLEGLNDPYAAYSTHTPGRARVVIPYAEPLPYGQHRRIAMGLCNLFDGDKSAARRAQFFFNPTHQPGVTPWAFNTLQGVPHVVAV